MNFSEEIQARTFRHLQSLICNPCKDELTKDLGMLSLFMTGKQ
jgi:hypothetical protein